VPVSGKQQPGRLLTRVTSRVNDVTYCTVWTDSCCSAPCALFYFISLTWTAGRNNHCKRGTSCLCFLSVTMPVLLLTLSLIFDVTSSLGTIYRPLFVGEMWLVVYATAYSAGLTLRHRRASHAAAVLIWISKPSMLLGVLLYTTLGLCLNSYVFSIDPRVPLSSVLLPAAGYWSVYVADISLDVVDRLRDVTAGRHGRRRRLSTRCHAQRRRSFIRSVSRETIATESGMCNGLLVLVITRFSLNDPDSDSASAVALWLSVLSPVPPIVSWLRSLVRRKYARWKTIHSARGATFNELIVVSSMPAGLQRVNDAFSLRDSVKKHSGKFSTRRSPAARNVTVERVTVV